MSKIKNLVIVESPSKSKTIGKFLDSSFSVVSSVGHIRDIPKKKDKNGIPPIDIDNNFATRYEVDIAKKKLISELKKQAKEADEVWIATDEDREGEAIGWHLCEVLGLDPLKTKRIVFHEITKSAIEKAIASPRNIDMHLVSAQQARRVLDRLVGFDLSPVVQRKVPGGKSAGRVQSPAVRLLVEREREIMNYEASSTFKVSAEFKTSSTEEFKAELDTKFDEEQHSRGFLDAISGAKFSVKGLTTSPGVRNPGAPYTTSTLQQDAASRLGFSVKATMTSAQRLYQAGKITYMRTDSVNLAPEAIAAIGSYIKNTYGSEYHHLRTFKTKSASAQEAHEAIRPTDPSLVSATTDEYDQKLYNLIRSRALASQMAPARIEKSVITIGISGLKEHFEAKGEVVLFPGFMKVYGTNKKDDIILPRVEKGEQLDLVRASAREVFSRPPARYTEGSLVKKLEELGIGRPSTYATIISTIQDRGYAFKGESEGTEREVIVYTLTGSKLERSVEHEKTGSDKGKLVPTPSGAVVSDFLSNYFEQVVDYGFTAHVEDDFDKIAEGKLIWHKMLKDFYGPFKETVIKSAEISRSEASQAREVGIDPKTGKTIYARFGRYGPMLQLGESDNEEEKPLFASMPKGEQIETITIDTALKAFELPRLVGLTDDGQEIKANIGRFGPYIQVGKLYVSIKPHDPHDIDLETAKNLYLEKLEKDANKVINTFGDIQVLNGFYGPYVTNGKKNARIPKNTDPKSLTEADCFDLLAKAPDKKTRSKPTSRRKKSKK